MYQHLNNKPMTIGLVIKLAFSYIDDSLEPLWNSAVKPMASKEIINLGGIKSVSILEANKTLKDVIGDGKTTFLEGRHEVEHAIPTFQKSVDILVLIIRLI